MIFTYINPEDVWDYCKNNNPEFDLVAENSDFGIKIWISSEGNVPTLSATLDGESLDNVVLLSREDATETTEMFFRDYLEKWGTEESYNYEENEVVERETDLELAAFDFIETACPNINELVDDEEMVYKAVVDMFCIFMQKHFGVSVYRPMFVKNKKGEEEYVEFPYDGL